MLLLLIGRLFFVSYQTSCYSSIADLIQAVSSTSVDSAIPIIKSTFSFPAPLCKATSLVSSIFPSMPPSHSNDFPLTLPSACTTLGLPMDIFDFDISPTGPAKKLDMGSCAYETGVKEGKVTSGGANSEHSFGGGLTFKEKTTVVENLKEKVVGSSV
jgi:hypothetical protein